MNYKTDTEKLSSFVNETNLFAEIYKKHKHNTSYTIQQLLSSTRNLKETLFSSLTGVNAHPYEKIKKQYLKENKTIEEIEIPKNFCMETCTNEISSIWEDLNKEWECQTLALTACSQEGSANNINNIGNAFATLSENVFVVDEKRASNHVQFVEMVKNIPIQLIEQQPNQVAQKILSQFITLYKK